MLISTSCVPNDSFNLFISFLSFCAFFLCCHEVLDDEDSNNITAGSIVTVTVTLTRKRMSVSSCYVFL